MCTSVAKENLFFLETNEKIHVWHVYEMLCPRDVAGLLYTCALLQVCEKNTKKIIWRKTVAIHNVFKEKTTKLNS